LQCQRPARPRCWPRPPPAPGCCPRSTPR
jgi:hypothetical protein